MFKKIKFNVLQFLNSIVHNNLKYDFYYSYMRYIIYNYYTSGYYTLLSDIIKYYEKTKLSCWSI